MYRRILVPVDGSETSKRGLEEAVRLAKEQHARLRLIYVIDQTVVPDLDGGFYTKTVLDALRQSGEKVLAEAMKVVKAEKLEVESRILENFTTRVAEAIIHDARSWPANLIVMGTHGRRGVSHLFLGSDAEAVVRLSPVPVLLVRAASVAAEAKQAVAA